MSSKRTKQLEENAPENAAIGDEARLNLWAATGTLEASDVLAFRRGDTDLVELEARHVALVDAIDNAQVLEPVVIDSEARTSGPRTDRWSQHRATA